MQNQNEKCSHCNGTGMVSDFLGYSESPCHCRRAVPWQAPPRGDYPPLPKPAHQPYIDDNGNVRAHGGYSAEQLMLYVATDRAERQAAPAARLTKPARVCGGTFGVGVQERHVIEAAQRHYELEGERETRTPEQRADEERKRRAMWDMVNGPLAASRQAPAAPEERDAEIAGLSASVGHLSALVDGQHALLKKAKAAMTALHGAALPIDESGGDLDARIPELAFARFVDAHAELLHAMAQSPVAAPAVDEQQAGSVWRWQADGQDQLESMGNHMGVLIRACDLRALLAGVSAPAVDALTFEQRLSDWQHADALDAERYRYAELHGWPEYSRQIHPVEEAPVWSYPGGKAYPSPRAAIDAAMAAQGKEGGTA